MKIFLIVILALVVLTALVFIPLPHLVSATLGIATVTACFVALVRLSWDEPDEEEIPRGNHWTAYDLAHELLDGPNLPVMRATDGRNGAIVPVMSVKVLVACDEEGQPTRRMIVLDDADRLNTKHPGDARG